MAVNWPFSVFIQIDIFPKCGCVPWCLCVRMEGVAEQHRRRKYQKLKLIYFCAASVACRLANRIFMMNEPLIHASFFN